MASAMVPDGISETRVLDEVVKNSLQFCQAKEDTVASGPNPGEFDEDFYDNSLRVKLLKRLGCVQGLHSSSLLSGNLDELLWFL